MVAVVLRVYAPGQPAFRLRPGEEGLSVFDPNLVDPPLTEAEVLEGFRLGSRVWMVPVEGIEARRLVPVRVSGADLLPVRCVRLTWRSDLALVRAGDSLREY